MATTNTTGPLSVFEHNGDVGAVHLPGGAYFGEDGLVVTGSGHNMWLDQDEFHFVWREVEGDWSLSTTAHFRGDGVGAHRKAVVLVRQDLGTSAVYAGIALHGDGLTSLQYRSKVGALTDEIRFSSNAPTRLGVRKVGDRVEAAASGESHAVQLALTGRYYIGVAVCSHVDDVLETVDFSEVKLSPLV